MGLLHAKKIMEIENKGLVELVGIADVDDDRCKEIFPEHPSRREKNYEILLNQVDAAVVAVPTVEHFTTVKNCLDAGLHVLVEKPISLTAEEGDALLSLANRNQRVLQVGHVEWFNPTLLSAMGKINEPHFIETNRLGPFSKRGSDIDVVRDLMIHDIDIVQRLFGEEPASIDSTGVSFVTDKVDIAKATMYFSNDRVAHLNASRVSEVQERNIRIFQGTEYFFLDLLKKEFFISEVKVANREKENEVRSIKQKIDASDALLNEVKVFVESVTLGRTLVNSAEAGVGALRTASRIVEGISS